MPQHDDKHHKNKKIVVIEKVRDKYGSVIALKVVLYRRHDTENGKVWDVNYRDGEHRGLSLPGGDGGVD